MRRLFRLLLAFVMLCFCGVGMATAQTFSPDEQDRSVQESNATLINQQKYLRGDANQQRFLQLEKPVQQTVAPLIPTPTPIAGPVPKFKISKIILEGITRLSSSQQHYVVAPYMGKALSINDVTSIVRDITNLYIQEGYVTTRVYIPKQNLASGNLTLNVLEGKISDIVWRDGKDRGPGPLEAAFPGLKGRVLRLQDIEQGMDQLNRLYHAQYTMQLMPSETRPGETVVVIDTYFMRPEGVGSVRYDNLQSNATQIYPGRLDFLRENLFGYNDQWDLGFTANSNNYKSPSTSLSLSGSVPFGYTTFSGYANTFDYVNQVPWQTRNFLSSGHSDTVQAQVETVVFRSTQTKTSIFANLCLKNVKSYTEDVLSDIGSRRLSIAELGLNQLWRSPWGIFTGGFQYAVGLPDFYAKQDASSIQPGEAHAQFKKLSADLTGTQTLWLAGMPVTFRGSYSTQTANTTLYATERMGLGDLYTVRGFRFSPVQGDVGWYGRFEITTPGTVLGIYRPMREWARDAGIQTFIGLDVGYAKTAQNNPSNGNYEGHLAGYAFGLRAYTPHLNWELTAARPIYASAGIPRDAYQIYWAATFLVW